MGPKLIPSSTLQTPLITSLPSNNQGQELQAVSQIIDLLKTRKDPVIVVDGGKLKRLFPHNDKVFL
jgi:pyruvate decarboxylase